MALVLIACLILGGFIHVSDSLCLEVEQRAMTDPTAKECKPNNRSAALDFVNPYDRLSESVYPQTHRFEYLNRMMALECCATGFSVVNWYKDGVKLSPFNSWTHCYSDEDTRQQLMWYSLQPPFPVTFSTSTIYKIIFTCEAISADGQTSISNNITIQALQLPTLSQNLPVFTKFQVEETCVEEGENITISCSLSYPVNELLQTRRIVLLNENSTLLALDSNKFHYNLTVVKNESHFQAVIPKVDKDWLNKKYYCQAASHPQVVSGAMYVSGGPCAKVAATNSIVHEVLKESNLSVAIAVPLALLVIIVVLVFTLTVRYNTYYNMWYHVNVVQRLKSALYNKGDYKYAAYMVYSDIDHPAVTTFINTIESRFCLKLCVPDRDFTIGSVTPLIMSECLKSSEKIIIFLSNDMFTQDETKTDWSDTSLSLSLALCKPTIIILLGTVEPEVLSRRKDLRAALKIMKTLHYESPDYNQELADALLSSFNFQIM